MFSFLVTGFKLKRTQEENLPSFFSKLTLKNVQIKVIRVDPCISFVPKVGIISIKFQNS